ncbi:hypothetical protein Pint_16633 [Pistacia integerrima]|uniref:Uncharacterized protein n=1 Tax=Pistacia integerrima TaxID=434235 RepID=A0ACC0Z9Z0_9ROSI|nr:hypothetical protein Pint_16633 [Pistacia integerrima]
MENHDDVVVVAEDDEEEDEDYNLMKSFESSPERFSSTSETVFSFPSPSYSSSSYATPTFKTSKEEKKMIEVKKIDRKISNFAYSFCDHVKMGVKFSETVKGKLSLGARIIQQGGRENIFKQVFGLGENEELLKASQCYLSTTSGPIAGLLFISTEKVAFCSERSITFSSSDGQLIKSPYKVMIPIRKIKNVHESENLNKPEKKYIEIVTVDDFEFWFMGFLRYEKAFRNLQKAIAKANQM